MSFISWFCSSSSSIGDVPRDDVQFQVSPPLNVSSSVLRPVSSYLSLLFSFKWHMSVNSPSSSRLPFTAARLRLSLFSSSSISVRSVFVSPPSSLFFVSLSYPFAKAFPLSGFHCLSHFLSSFSVFRFSLICSIIRRPFPSSSLQFFRWGSFRFSLLSLGLGQFRLAALSFQPASSCWAPPPFCLRLSYLPVFQSRNQIKSQSYPINGQSILQINCTATPRKHENGIWPVGQAPLSGSG